MLMVAQGGLVEGHTTNVASLMVETEGSDIPLTVPSVHALVA